MVERNAKASALDETIQGRATRAFILEAIAEHQNHRGFPPTVQDLCKAVNLRSTSSVHRQLRLLRDAGIVTFEDGLPRTLRIVKPWSFDLSTPTVTERISSTRGYDIDHLRQLTSLGLAQQHSDKPAASSANGVSDSREAA